MDVEELFWKGFVYTVCAVMLGLVALGFYSAFKCVQADGQVTYCYAEYFSPTEMPPVIRLNGFRPWRPDRRIGTYNTLEEASKAAELVGCKIEKK